MNTMRWTVHRAFLAAVLAGTVLLPQAAQDVQPTSRRFYERGVQKQETDDLYGAAEDFLEALRINPAYGDAWLRLAELSYALGDYTLALDYLNNADKYIRGRTDVLNLRGMTLISLGELSEARAVFEDVISRYPNDIDARFGLAELDLYDGRLDGARRQYLDALKRQQNNRKALLALALLASENGNDTAAHEYLQQALRYHSGESEVQYLAAYMESKAGNLEEAERRARAAVQIKGDYTRAYVLLASILYGQGRYGETADICDYLISRDRNTVSAWYLKGLSLYRQGRTDDAIDVLDTALGIASDDEVMRAVLELLVNEALPLESTRRARWADYHVQKAREHVKLFQGEEARYEYQRALKLDPNNAVARGEFAEVLSRVGLNEQYVNQLRFVTDRAGTEALADDSATRTRIADTIEAYDSLMKRSLGTKWNIDPFYLDKTRWHIGVYYAGSSVQLLHSDAELFTARMLREVFSGISTTAVEIQDHAVSGYGEAFRVARKSGMDYFVLLDVEESDREVVLRAQLYSARTGTETARFSISRTGNGRYAAALRSFRRNLLDLLPVRGKIVARSVNEILVDVGRTEGMAVGAELDVIRAGGVQTVDKGAGVTFAEKDLLGTITVTAVGEEISQGKLVQIGFYDRVNVGDEVLVKMLPASDSAVLVSDTAPSANEQGTPADGRRLTTDDLGRVRTPAILELIRSIR